MKRSGEKSRSRAKYVGCMSTARERTETTSDKKASSDEVCLADNERPRLYDAPIASALSVRDREIGPRQVRSLHSARCRKMHFVT